MTIGQGHGARTDFLNFIDWQNSVQKKLFLLFIVIILMIAAENRRIYFKTCKITTFKNSDK